MSASAKVIVLGDSKVGKSSLIHNLDPQTRAGFRGSEDFGAEDIIFSVVEFPIAELLGTAPLATDPLRNNKLKPSTPVKLTGPSVYLKIWEHSSRVSKEEEELAFRGALFCIIVLDLRSPESAKNVFAKWVMMKEKFMNECFLFVVGTHVDKCSQRRVDIAEVCKACAQKEAIYTEVSNYDGTNISLLRRLMAQRINYVLSIRDSMAKTIPAEIEAEKKGESPVSFMRSPAMDNEFDEYSEEAKAAQDHEKMIQNLEGHLNAPFLEQDLVCDSIGSILASALGTEFWPGYEVEEEYLSQIGKTLSGYVDKLTTDSKSLPKAPLDVSLQALHPGSDQEALSAWAMGGGVEGTSMYDLPEPDIESLKHVFEVMGFALPQTFLPDTLNTTPIHKENGNGTSKPPASNSNEGSFALDKTINSSPRSDQRQQHHKLKVRLPDGSMSTLIIYPGYEVADQVDAFMVQYGMDDDKASRTKLISAAMKLRAAGSTGDLASNSVPTSPFPSGPSASSKELSPRQSVASPGSTTPQISGRKSLSAAGADPFVADASSTLAGDMTPLQRRSTVDIRKETVDQTGSQLLIPAEKSVDTAVDVNNSTPATKSSSTISAVKTAPRTPLMVPASTSRPLGGLSTVKTLSTSMSNSVNHAAASNAVPKQQSKKCKIRIQLPDFAGGAVETVVREGQDLQEVARSIAAEHNLSWGYQQKVYDQLRAAFKR